VFGEVPAVVDSYPAGHTSIQVEESDFKRGVEPEQDLHY
jgi:hypothetical protein